MLSSYDAWLATPPEPKAVATDWHGRPIYGGWHYGFDGRWVPEEEGGDAIGPLIEVEGEVVDYNETFYPDGGYFRRGVNGLVAEGDEQDYLHTFYQLEDLTQTF